MAAVAADPAKVATGAGALHTSAPTFDLKAYLGEKKEAVEQALDASLQVCVCVMRTGGHACTCGVMPLRCIADVHGFVGPID